MSEIAAAGVQPAWRSAMGLAMAFVLVIMI
jgi:hypothetical protein